VSYGLQVLAANGTAAFDGSRLGGVFMEMLTLTQGTSGSRSYPDFTGRTLVVSIHYASLTNQAVAYNVWSISYPSGVPTLTWNYPTASGGPNVYLQVFIK
jgi:hypothetical protein